MLIKNKYEVDDMSYPRKRVQKAILALKSEQQRLTNHVEAITKEVDDINQNLPHEILKLKRSFEACNQRNQDEVQQRMKVIREQLSLLSLQGDKDFEVDLTVTMPNVDIDFSEPSSSCIVVQSLGLIVDDVQSERVSLQKEIDYLKAKLQAYQKEKTRLEKIIRNLKEKINRVDQAFDQIKGKLDAYMTELDQRITKNRESTKELEHVYENFFEQLCQHLQGNRNAINVIEKMIAFSSKIHLKGFVNGIQESMKTVAKPKQKNHDWSFFHPKSKYLSATSLSCYCSALIGWCALPIKYYLQTCRDNPDCDMAEFSSRTLVSGMGYTVFLISAGLLVDSVSQCFDRVASDHVAFQENKLKRLQESIEAKLKYFNHSHIPKKRAKR